MINIFKSKFLSNKKIQILIAVILSMIILLIAFGGQESSVSEEIKESTVSDFQSYEKDIEGRIETIVNSISGISDAKAFVYTRSSVEIVYAEDIEKKLSSKEEGIVAEVKTIVFSKDGTTSAAVIVKKIYPQIEGVLVVAKGADDEKKRIMIINALTSVLGINIGAVEVLSGSG